MLNKYLRYFMLCLTLQSNIVFSHLISSVRSSFDTSVGQASDLGLITLEVSEKHCSSFLVARTALLPFYFSFAGFLRMANC